MGGAPDQDDADGSWIRGAELSETQPQGAPGPGESAASPVSCWRCQLEYAGTLEKCPHCGAQKRRAAAASQTVALSSGDHRPLGALIWAYSIMLGVGLALVGFQRTLAANEALDLSDLQATIIGAELFQGILCLVYLWISRGCCPQPPAPPWGPTLAWSLALPVLAAALAVNVGYHFVLRQIVGVGPEQDILSQSSQAFLVLVVCVEPAIIEELFCRHRALGVLRQYVGAHGAVWISATMFALLHIAAFLSVPYLLLLGAVLAYLRIASGTLLLPMLMHFLHNLLISIWLQEQMVP
ncbi:MAG: CPBP family intramembrane metalloprotease [Planctomycetales bacterium]|nr:CPBP family intramembrane metalloprotease [Planctomycetales bacterium]